MSEEKRIYDVIVVGGGHAGCEACLASARLGADTLLLQMNLDTIAKMSCNPAIGGQAKGQMVREIDAMGGAMGRVIDRAGIQFRILNMSKGPAVRAPRAQADKVLYQFTMKHVLEEQENLSIRQDTVKDVQIENGRAVAVVSQLGTVYRGRAIVLTNGTFLRGKCHEGLVNYSGGRAGDSAAYGLSERMSDLGFEVGRMKTGTPPRLNGRTVDFSAMKVQPGDDPPRPFSYMTEEIPLEQVPCHVTWTTPETHEIIRDHLDESPMYTGVIEAVGPRYCPSIEDKVVRFSDRDRHQIFVEPEGLNTNEIYCNGISTSLPRHAQERIVHSIPGLEKAQITRYGYAVEYDFFPPTQLHPTLETKPVENLYFAGQINGTSGYEEAAGQGLMAGANAALKLAGEGPFLLDRSEAYIGVLIDDLVTLGTKEPYRMFSSRAEYRLLLRQDNADRRLTKKAAEFGLVGPQRLARVEEKETAIERARAHLQSVYHDGASLEKILRRPESSWETVLELDSDLRAMELDDETAEAIEIEVKYEGYIKRQADQVARFKKLESHPIPENFSYEGIEELRAEAKEKLEEIQPRNLGQASRISGVNPTDIAVLTVHVKKAEDQPVRQ